jgi:hypothetical protein
MRTSLKLREPNQTADSSSSVPWWACFRPPYVEAPSAVYCYPLETPETGDASILLQVGSRTSVTKFTGLRDYRFFGACGKRMPVVHSNRSLPSRKTSLSKLCVTLLALLAISGIVLGDTPGRLQSKPAPSCYCHCSRAHSRGGCVTMCELPKFASRWWAKSCARTRLHTPTENHDAGPRLHHADHAERAAR